ncbi:MAG: N-acetyltransferase [Deltaproteobacteria bacterium]|nr:N-acetyltransferase [Deltaproteobacteria bacterium]
MSHNETEMIKVVHDVGKTQFFCDIEGYRCFVEYEITEEGMIDIQHTMVNENLRGRGIAAVLLKEVSAFAQREGRKVIPTCSYAAKFYEKSREYAPIIVNEVAEGKIASSQP